MSTRQSVQLSRASSQLAEYGKIEIGTAASHCFIEGCKDVTALIDAAHAVRDRLCDRGDIDPSDCQTLADRLTKALARIEGRS